jgi:hypothetical protein
MQCFLLYLVAKKASNSGASEEESLKNPYLQKVVRIHLTVGLLVFMFH